MALGVCGKGLDGGENSEVRRMVMPESELEESCRSLSCNTADIGLKIGRLQTERQSSRQHER